MIIPNQNTQTTDPNSIIEVIRELIQYKNKPDIHCTHAHTHRVHSVLPEYSPAINWLCWWKIMHEVTWNEWSWLLFIYCEWTMLIWDMTSPWPHNFHNPAVNWPVFVCLFVCFLFFVMHRARGQPDVQKSNLHVIAITKSIYPAKSFANLNRYFHWRSDRIRLSLC